MVVPDKKFIGRLWFWKRFNYLLILEKEKRDSVWVAFCGFGLIVRILFINQEIADIAVLDYVFFTLNPN